MLPRSLAYGLGLTHSVILAQYFLLWIRKYIENVILAAYVGWARVLSYRSTVHKKDTPVRFGNVGGSVFGTSTGLTSDVIKQISDAVR